MKVLRRSLMALAVIWLIGCQALLSAVLLKIGSLPDVCDSRSMPEACAWFLAIGTFGLAGGIAFALLPGVVVFFGYALFARFRGNASGAGTGAMAGSTDVGFLAVGCATAMLLAMPSLGPAWLRVALVVLIDALFLWTVRKLSACIMQADRV